MEELISVIVPVYNTESNALETCFRCLEEQSYQNVEIIIVDGGSNDHTKDIIKHYCSENKKWRLISTTKGVSHQRNVGIENSNGSFITFIDSDDYFNKNFIRCLYNSLKETESDVAIPMSHRCIYDGDRLIEDIPYDICEIKEQVTQQNYFKYARPAELVETRKLYKASLIKDVKFNLKCSYGEVMIFNYELSKKGFSTCFVPEAIYYFRVIKHSNSAERRFNTKGWYLVKFLASIIRSKIIKSEESLKGLYGEFDFAFLLFYYALARNKKVFRLIWMIQFKPIYLRNHHNIHDILFMLFPIIVVTRRNGKSKRLAQTIND